jgi:hypothetical protein
MRGFHGCLLSAHAIMKGLEINYNLNRNHMSLGKKTPAEIAIPQLKLGINKWLDLIKLSKILSIMFSITILWRPCVMSINIICCITHR